MPMGLEHDGLPGLDVLLARLETGGLTSGSGLASFDGWTELKMVVVRANNTTVD